MSLPATADIETLDYAFNGQPFANVDAGTGVATAGLDYAFNGQPFVSPSASGGGGGGVGAGPASGRFFMFM